MSVLPSLLQVSDGSSPAAMLPVLGARLTSLEISGDLIEGGNHGCDGWRKSVAGSTNRHVTIKVAGIYLGEAGETRLRTLAFSGMPDLCAVRIGDGSTLSGAFAVKQLIYSEQQGEPLLYEAVLESVAPLTLAAAI